MVKPPRVRHSKTQREPMTIDLEPGEVSRVASAESPADDGAAAAEPVETSARATDDTGPVAASSDDAAPEESSAAAESRSETSTADSLLDAAEASTGSAATIEAQADIAEAASAKPTAEPARKPFGRDDAASSSWTPQDSKPAEPVRTAPPPRRGSLSGLGAGLLGGIAALAIAWALQTAGVLPGGSTPPADNSEAIAALQAQVTVMKSEIANLKEPPAALIELRKTVADQNTRIDGVAQNLEALTADLGALRQAVEQGGAGDGAAVQALEARIREIESAVAALGQGNGQADAAALQALGSRIATLEAAVQSAAAATGATDARIATLEQSLAALGQKIDALGGQPKIALAIAAAALRSALDRGGTFTAEVETFAAIAPNSPDLAALREIAAKGIATRTEIAAEMADAATAMIAAGDVPDPDAGFFDSLWEGIGSLVTVRPIGEVEGAGVPESVARMEVAVQQGDLVKALAEYDTLSEPAKAAGATFAEKIRTRLAAEQLIEKALADALKAA